LSDNGRGSLLSADAGKDINVSFSASDHHTAARVGAAVIEEEIASAIPPELGFSGADPNRQRQLIELCASERLRVRLRFLWTVMAEMRAHGATDQPPRGTKARPAEAERG
jgi:hypothetical protein